MTKPTHKHLSVIQVAPNDVMFIYCGTLDGEQWLRRNLSRYGQVYDPDETMRHWIFQPSPLFDKDEVITYIAAEIDATVTHINYTDTNDDDAIEVTQ